jgi:orotidine-5'-phosphate decarboxylase
MRAADVAVALDLPSAEAALALVDRLGASATWVKVGPMLFVRAGPALVGALLARGKRVFLDLKWHDIPATVAGAVTAAAALGVELATVHLAGGAAMLRAAADARAGGLRLVGVGVLTSLDHEAYGRVVARRVTDLVAEQERLLVLGSEAGLDGFVCAPAEVARLRAAWGNGAPFVVTPGIRPAGAPADDQARSGEAAVAAAAGADLLVVGRPVTLARDPAAALAAIWAEIAA